MNDKWHQIKTSGFVLLRHELLSIPKCAVNGEHKVTAEITSTHQFYWDDSVEEYREYNDYAVTTPQFYCEDCGHVEIARNGEKIVRNFCC